LKVLKTEEKKKGGVPNSPSKMKMNTVVSLEDLLLSISEYCSLAQPSNIEFVKK